MLLLAHAAFGDAVEVATVNHGLRAEALEECGLVMAGCRARNIKCAQLNVQLESGNIQSRARQARYAALLQWAEERNLSAIATAHHADDQAETFLMRLNRGSGLQGLSAIRAQRLMPGATVPIIRPLLGFRRSELRDLVQQAGEPFADDPSNDDARFDRVRMRQRLAKTDWIDPVAIAQSARHLEESETTLAAIGRDHFLSNARREEGRIILPCLDWIDTNARMIILAAEELGCSLSYGDVMDVLKNTLVDVSKANIGGVLIEKRELSWRVSPEPPRRGSQVAKPDQSED